MKTMCFSILFGLLGLSAAWGQSQVPTREDAERELGPFRDFLATLVHEGKLPGLKTNEHGTVNYFRVNGQLREAWLTKEMRSEANGCKDAFLATVYIPLTERHLQYLYCREGDSFRLISIHKEKKGPWPDKIGTFPPERDRRPVAPEKRQAARSGAFPPLALSLRRRGSET